MYQVYSEKRKAILLIEHQCFYCCLLLIVFIFPSCKKIVNIPPPVNTITTSQVFSTDQQATAAAAGMYYNMVNYPMGFANSGLTFFGGLSADELVPFNQDPSDDVAQFWFNNVGPENGTSYSNIWSNAYSTIYKATSIIQGLAATASIHDSVKNELIGEAKFVRAFSYFYLVNLFGKIPLVLTIDYNKTSLLSQASVHDIYNTIVGDLLDAKNRLPEDFSVGHNQRIIPNKWAAIALLARVYLFEEDYANAKEKADEVINAAALFSLQADLNDVFLANSKEAIWQLQQDNSGAIESANATYEGFKFALPATIDFPPFLYLSPQLVSNFDSSDLRKRAWVETTIYDNNTYYEPFKYKIGYDNRSINGPYIEYYTVLRLAEQYLIRAEAKTLLGDFSGAATDLNAIRNRAGLQNYNGPLNKDSLLESIYHEKRLELFCEWGNRWFDLKRTGKANEVLAALKGTNWQTTDQMYPIPVNELQTDPNLTQNDGYK